MPQHTFESTTKIRRLNLRRVTWTDGVECISKNQTGLQQIQTSVKFHLLPVEVFPIQTGHRHIPVPEIALIGQIMNG